MSWLPIFKTIFFFVRRAFVRVIGLFGYALVAERAGWAGLEDAIWNQGHFWAFLLIGMTCSWVIDLVIEVTKPDLVLTHKPEGSCESEES